MELYSQEETEILEEKSFRIGEFYRTLGRKGIGGGFYVEDPFLIWFYHECHFLLLLFLGLFAELRKTTISFVMSVHATVRMGTAGLPLDGF